MDYWFVYNFVIFSFIDDYDDAFDDLEWFQMRIYIKKRGKSQNIEAENFSKKGRVHD